MSVHDALKARGNHSESERARHVVPNSRRTVPLLSAYNRHDAQGDLAAYIQQERWRWAASGEHLVAVEWDGERFVLTLEAAA